MKKVVIACCIIVAVLLVYALINGANNKPQAANPPQQNPQMTHAEKEKANQQRIENIRKSEEALIALSTVDNGGVWTQDQIKKLCHFRWVGKPKRFEKCLENNKPKLGKEKEPKEMNELKRADKLAEARLKDGNKKPAAAAPVAPATAAPATPVAVPVQPQPVAAPTPKPTQPTP